MSEDSIIRHCAPTLAGLKTGNLFTCSYTTEEEIREDIRRLNEILVPRGVRVLPMRFSPRKVLVYVYRPGRLAQDLANRKAANLLDKNGYSGKSSECCVACLSKKLKENQDFPHEIGLFLGYPPEDVRGFIEQGPDCCKCLGCWKVYDDVEASRKKFNQFDQCSRVYRDRWKNGSSLERLTVASPVNSNISPVHR
ncbi:MAG: DUF3793 family protein [Eubacteriaceae bacterium]|jgi:hypothetical protein